MCIFWRRAGHFLMAPIPPSPELYLVLPCVPTLRAVRVLIVLAPQFWIKVLGTTSRALLTARYGHWCIPVILLAFSFKA